MKTWLVFKDTHEFKGMPDFAIKKKNKLKIEESHEQLRTWGEMGQGCQDELCGFR